MSEHSGPLRVLSYTQSCVAVPSQWEGTLEDGRMFYIRFRNGRLRVSVSPAPTTDVRKAVSGGALLEQLVDGPDDGFMEEDEMLERTASVLAFAGSTRLQSDD